MHKRVLVVLALALVSVPVFAGTYLMNDTGQTVYGLRVTFSEPVTITGYGDALTKVDPTSQATQFTFSDGEVSVSGGEWFNWEPTSAKLESSEWVVSAEGVSSGSGIACHRDVSTSRVLSYVSDPDISFYCDRDREWENAQFWGFPGHHVKSVDLEYAEGNLNVTLSLYPDDTLGKYQYHIEFRFEDKTSYINLYPANQAAEIIIATPETWDVRARYSGRDVQQSSTSMQVEIPLADFFDSVVACRIPLITPSFHISYDQAGRRELFFFPSTAAGGLLLAENPTGEETAPPVPVFKTPMRGVHIGGSFTYWNGANNLDELPEEYFLYLESLNVEWVGIGPAGGGLQNAWDTSFPGLNLSKEQFRRLCQKLHAHGFKVYVMVSTWFWHFGEAWPNRANLGAPNVFDWCQFPNSEDWPWNPTYPRHEAFVEEFFQSYTEETVELAKLCEEEHVEMLALGTETDWLFRTRDEYSRLGTEFRDELCRMTQQVRHVYSGLLTYDMSYSSLCSSDLRENSLEMWGDLELDVIGLSMYPRLFETRPTGVPSVQELKERWQRIFDAYLVPLRRRYPSKPIVFTEFGFINAVGTTYANTEGKGQIGDIVDSNSNGVDDGEEEQANAMAALFEVMMANPGVVEGVFVWGQWIQTVQEWSETLAKQRDHWVRGRLAQKVICEYYGRWGGLEASDIETCCVCPESASMVRDRGLATGSASTGADQEVVTTAESGPVVATGEQTGSPLIEPVAIYSGGHFGHLRNFDYRPDGALIATAGYDEFSRIYDVKQGAFTTVKFRHPRLPMCVCFDPTGCRIATGGSDQLVRIWDVGTGTLIHTLVGHQYYVRYVSFSSDGKLLASAGSDAPIHIWDVESGAERTVLYDHAPRAAVQFSPDGRYLVSGSYNGEILLLDANSFNVVNRLEGHGDIVTTTAFSQDSQLMATGEEKGPVKLWELPSGRCLRTLKDATGWTLVTLALNPAGDLLSTGDYKTGAISVWATDTGSLIKKLTPVSRVVCLQFSPDGTRLAASFEDGRLVFWDTKTWQPVRSGTYHRDLVTGMVSVDGRLITASWDGSILQWEDGTASPFGELDDGQDPIICMEAFSDSKIAAIGRESGTLQLLDLTTGELIWSDVVDKSGILSVCWTNDGTSVVWGSTAGNVGTVTSTAPFRKVSVANFAEAVYAIRQSPRTGELALGLSDGTIAFVDLLGKRGRELLGHVDSVYCLAFSPDGRVLYSGGRDGTVREWDLSSAESSQLIGTHDGSVYDLMFLDKYGVLISAAADRTVRVWDASSLECMSVLGGASAGVMALCWDDKIDCVAGGSRGDVLFWGSCALSSLTTCPENTNLRTSIRCEPLEPRPASTFAGPSEGESSKQHSAGAIGGSDEELGAPTAGLPASYQVIQLKDYSPDAELPVDGFSEGSVPLAWWYSFDETEGGPDFHGLVPVFENGEQLIRYRYPDDGNVGTVIAQFKAAANVSSYKALVIAARADHAISATIKLTFFDCNLPGKEEHEPCGGSSAVFEENILVDETARVFILPLSGFHVDPWIIKNVPGASGVVDFTRVWEFKISPGDEATIEIMHVAFAKLSLSASHEEGTARMRILFDEAHNELNTISEARAQDLRPDHPEWVFFEQLVDRLGSCYRVARGTETITDQLLEEEQVLVISIPAGFFSAAEVDAIKQFVNDGGGLLVMGSFAGYRYNEILSQITRAFGIQFLDCEVLSSTFVDKPERYFSGVLVDSPITQGVEHLLVDHATALDIGESAIAISWSGPDTWLDCDNDSEADDDEMSGPFVQTAATTYGEGRVVAIADDCFANWALRRNPDNLTFFLNVIKWLLKET